MEWCLPLQLEFALTHLDSCYLISASRRAPGERVREEEALVAAVKVTPSEPTVDEPGTRYLLQLYVL